MAGNTPTQLPAYIALRYEENGVFDKFQSEAERAASETKKRFNQAFSETERVVTGAVGRINSQFGKIDLGVGQFREQQAQIRLYRDALDETARAGQRLAKETGDTSVRTREYLRALTEQRAEADRALNVANAQVATYTRLQGALDAAANSSSRLAASQREVFAEQARAAREEVSARERQNLYAVGFGYDRPAKSARDSADVFQSQGYKPSADLRDAVQKIRDGDAAMDRAALSGVTLEQVLGRVAGKSREVTAAVAAQARQDAEAAAENLKLAAAVDRLHAEIDPLVAVQQRYTSQVSLLDEALRRGAIDADRYAAIYSRLKNTLDEGTTATRNVINSQGALRQATLQSGQQLQDIVISLYSGQQASIVFAQQLPQLAFGLSGLEGSANKTHDRIGRFATFLSGPWGIAVGLAVGVAGTLIYKMIDAGEASDNLVGKLREQAVDAEKAAKAQEIFGNSVEGGTKAINEQKAALDKHEQSLKSDGERNLEAARKELAREIQIRKTTKALLEGLIAQEQANQAYARSPNAAKNEGLGSAAIQNSQDYITRAQKQLEQINKDIAKAMENVDRRQSFYDIEVGTKQADPLQRIRDQYEGPKGLIEQARRRAVAEGQTGDALQRQVTILRQKQRAAEDAVRANGQADRQYGREIDLSAARSIASGAGFRVTSGLRSRAEQQRLYDTVRTAENPVAKPGTSAHEKGNALDIAFGPGVSVASIRKAYAEQGVKLTKLLKETGHFHIEWSTRGADKAQNAAEAIAREAEAAARKAEQLAEYGRDVAARLASINDGFTDTPPLIARLNSGMSTLKDMSDDIGRRLEEGLDPKVAEQLKAEIARLKPIIEDSLNQPMRDFVRDQNERLAVQRLAAAGLDDEAQALQMIQRMERDRGEMTAQQKQDVLDRVRAESDLTRELARQRDLFDAQLDVINTARSSLRDLLSGRGGNPLKEISQSLKDLQGARLFDQLFGDVFDQLEDELRGRSPLAKESQGFADDLHLSRDALAGFTSGLSEAAKALAANDNAAGAGLASATVGGPSTAFIDAFRDLGAGEPAATAIGRMQGDQKVTATIARPSIQELALKVAGGVVAPFQSALNDALGTRFGQLVGGTVQGAIAGNMTGGTTGGILGAIRGAVFEAGPDLFGKGATENALGKLDGAMSGAATGSQIAGISKALGLKTSTTGAQVGGSLGALTGIPGGDIIGSIAGGLLGGLFKKTKKGYADNIMIGEDGDASYSLVGNSASRRKAGGEAADSLVSALDNIADQLNGGLLNSLNLGSLGMRKDKYTFDPTPGNSAGRQEFESQEEAVRAAMVYAIDKGVITGIRQSTQRLLSAGDDLDKALQDALTWENAFKELRRYKDPLGGAIDDLNSEFDKLIGLGTKAGASVEEMAQLEELYGIKRNEIIKDKAEELTWSLKDLLDELTVGDSGLSLRDRRANALSQYNPLKDRVAAGDTSAYDGYADAARALLDIERDLYGSQQSYFDRLNEVTALTRDRIGAERNVVSIAENRDSPFDSAGRVKDSINDQTAVLGTHFDALNANVGTMIQQLGGIQAALAGSGSGGRAIAFRSYY